MRAVAMIVTAMLATPCTVLALTAFQYLLGEAHASLGDPSTTEFWIAIPGVLLSLSGGGMILSLPAALLNLITVELFARYGIDSWAISALSGAAVGLAVHFVIFGVLLPGQFAEFSAIGAMVTTGVAIGILYWLMVVKSRRRLRMTQSLTA